MGRKSTVDLLPPDIRQRLEALLSDPRMTQLEITEEINQVLERHGIGLRLSKSAVNRYAQRMSAVLQKMHERNQVAEMWLAKFGRIPQGQLGQLIINMIHGLAFEAGLKLHDGEIDPDELPELVQMLRGLSVTIEKLERAASLNAEREAEIREAERRRAAEELAALENKPGLDAETIKKVREALYGA